MGEAIVTFEAQLRQTTTVGCWFLPALFCGEFAALGLKALSLQSKITQGSLCRGYSPPAVSHCQCPFPTDESNSS